MSEKIPAWAVERAIQEIGPRAEPWNIPHEEVSKGVHAFARYIAAHEQPPVDPDVLAVRDIIATYIEELRGDAWQSMRMRDGRYDGEIEFAAVLVAYRKHKEAGE